MRKTIKSLCGMLTLALAFTACYDDEGNYSYHDINEVGIVIPETAVRVPREGEVTVVITPALSQTIGANEENLTFQWYKGPQSATRICESSPEEVANDPDRHKSELHRYSTDKSCTLTITPSDIESIKLLLEVTDQREGTKWYAERIVNLVLPFSSTWFVLQEQDGKGVLGAADGEGELATVFADVYASEFGTTFPLEGKPLSIDAQHNYGIGSWNYTMGIMAPSPIAVLHIMTDSDLQLVRPSTLETEYNGREMLLGADTGQPLALETYAYGNYGEVAVAQGKTWHSLIDGYAVYYTVRNPEGEQLESKQWAEYGSNWVTFDEKKHRFLSYVYNSPDGMMTSYTSTRPMRAYGRAWSDAIPKTASVPQSGEPSLTDVFDADGPELASIEVLDFVSTGTWAYAIATGGTSPLTLYEFSSSAVEPTCSGLYELSLPNGAQAADCHFAASWGFGHILFMATGNKVYKIDLNRNNPAVSLIYEYTDDAAATAVALKFKDMDNSTYFHDLGVAFNRADGTGTVVELRLTQAGDVNREEGSTFEYTGFGTIVDLAFNHAE